MASSRKYDAVVIGAGIGGYVSAIRLAQLGKKVALIEKDRLGGMCLNWGCIPTKTLLATADFLGKVRQSEEFGLSLGEISVNFQKVMARKDAVVERLIRGVQFLVKKNKIQLVEGEGKILSRNQIRVLRADGSEETIDARNIVIATGSEEARPPYAEIDEGKILTAKGALRLRKAPESLAVIGGDVVGIEFAVIFNALGTNLKILEASTTLLPALDKDIGRSYQRILKKKGIEVHLNTEVRSVEVEPNGRVAIEAVEKDSQLDIETEKALITDLRRPVLEDLGLETVGVRLEMGSLLSTGISEQMCQTFMQWEM